jgi:hypothetical protein
MFFAEAKAATKVSCFMRLTVAAAAGYDYLFQQRRLLYLSRCCKAQQLLAQLQCNNLGFLLKSLHVRRQYSNLTFKFLQHELQEKIFLEGGYYFHYSADRTYQAD